MRVDMAEIRAIDPRIRMEDYDDDDRHGPGGDPPSGSVSLVGPLSSIDYILVAHVLIGLSKRYSRVHLWIHSPGGSVSGLGYLLDTIDEVRASGVEIVALVPAIACSAAYAVAVHCDAIVTGPDAHVGSIGTYAVIIDDRKYMENLGIKELVFVSGVSPEKVPDIFSDEYAKKLQAYVDELGDKFVRDVASQRGVTVDKVLTDFGRGAPVGAEEALRVGMIDSTDLVRYLISVDRKEAM